jgi:hypothetical protein
VDYVAGYGANIAVNVCEHVAIDINAGGAEPKLHQWVQ